MGAPVDSQCLAGHPARLFGGEVDDGRAGIFGCTQPADGNRGGHLSGRFGIAHVSHQTQSHTVDRHTAAGDLERQVPRKTDACRLPRLGAPLA